MPHDTSGGAASEGRSADRLARALLATAGDQSVRVIEAIAATLANGASGTACPCHLAEAPTPFVRDDPRDGDPRLEMCRRVARRALGGSLADPTGGATAFHRLDADPEWARDHLPVATFGPFLFYRL